MSGYFFVHRGVFEHHAFLAEPFTEREAWLWLIAEAAWKPTTVRIGRAIIELKRGQVAHARRYLAEAWQWHPSRVYRFLTRLSQSAMIEQLANSEATTITICNYDKYQVGRTAAEQQTEQPPNSPRTKEEELKNLRNYSAEGATVREQAREVISEVQPFLKIDPQFPPPEWMGAEHVIDGWITKGWKPEIIVSSIKSQAARQTAPPTRIAYYRNGIADAHANAEAPLPTGTRTTERRHGSTENLSQVARRLATEGVSFGPRPGTIPDPEDGNIVRLLPEGRRERS